MGFIGTYAANRLMSLGHQVTTFDTLSGPPPESAELLKGAEHFRGDLLNQLSLFEAIKKHKADRIMHLAALRNLDSQRNPYLAFRLNCEGTVNCYEAARIFGLERVVFASTSATVGSYEYYKPLGVDRLPDDLPSRPINVYGVTKAFDEMIGKEYDKIYGLNIVGVRLALIYGPGKKAGSKTSGWNDLIEGSLKGEPMRQSRLSDMKVSINYAKDASEAAVCAVLAKNPPSGTYNCTGHEVTAAEYCDAIRRVIPKADITMVDDGAKPATMGLFDTRGAREHLGYSPVFSLEQGIEDHVKTLSQ
ncbi:MAG: NAD(P)-dependent oxidoreductase [Synergistaceae bacterium]|nr:NAD(P)-dependent oxidoreductase [Synergistaceae bacterium]